MNNKELKEFLDELDSLIDDELSEFFNNSVLKSKFSTLVNIIVWNDDSLDDDIIDKLDVLTDNIDSFNFKDVKDNIDEIKDLLQLCQILFF